MSLERFRRTRMVVLTRQSMAYQAARAMADHHIGAVLVNAPPGLAGILTDRDLALAVLEGDFDRKMVPLGEVMSEGVVTCDIGADLDDVVRLMREHAVRRIPITKNGRPVGLVTFDDLVVDGAVSVDDLRATVTAQLEVEAPQKPAGTLHPKAPASLEGRTRALMRAKARAEATYNRMVKAVEDATNLDRNRSRWALFLVTCMLCRRLTPDEAQHLIAQLPSKLQPRLDECLSGPDRAVTAQAIKDELGRGLGLDPQGASETLRSVFKIIADSVAAGQIDEVRGQLPEEMRALFPVPA
jgi:CBS domain-containing protein/uncharacterized protein (DUF2267 family)